MSWSARSTSTSRRGGGSGVWGREGRARRDIGGTPLADRGAKELARRVAFVPQHPQMPAGMTVAQYVLLGRSPHLSYLGREGARDREVVAGVLRRLSLDGL